MIRRLVLLPGMDGTGDLFADLGAALPDEFVTEIVRYPSNAFHSYAELAPFVKSAIPASEPFVLLAESFSTPLAIQFAAANPPNLRGLVICAGFAKSPVRGWLRLVVSFAAPLLFRVTLPSFAARLLVGPNAPPALLVALRAAVSSVKPKVLSARLRAILACDVRAELARVNVPILYLRATQDRLVRASCLKEMRRIRPEISVAAIEGPHLLMQREPRQATEAVVEFVSELYMCPQ